MRRPNAPSPPHSCGHRTPTLDPHEVSRCIGEAKVPLALHAETTAQSGPKEPGIELIAAIVEMKRRNPRFGCRRIARQLSFIFGVGIDKEVVRRVRIIGFAVQAGTVDGPASAACSITPSRAHGRCRTTSAVTAIEFMRHWMASPRSARPLVPIAA